VTLPPFHRSRRISADQEQTLSPIKVPPLVNAASPTG